MPAAIAYRSLAIHDPKRSPPDYTAHVAEGEFLVFLRDVAGLHEVTPDAVAPAAGARPVCHVFASREDAVAFCLDLVERHPHVRCDVFTSRGKVGAPVRTIVHASRGETLPTRRKVRWMCVSAVLMMVVAPPLFYLDSRYKFTLIVPTLLGLKGLTLGLRILHWAHGMSGKVKEAEEAAMGGKPAVG